MCMRGGLELYVRLTEYRTVVGVPHVDGRTNISLHATRVVSQACIGSGCSAVDSTNGAQVNGHVGERSGCDETSANTRRERERRATIRSYKDRAIVLNTLAVAT